MPNLSHREVYMEWHKAAPRTVLGHLRGHCGGLKKPDLKRRFHANRNEPETIVSTMKTGAENYLKEFDSYDDETLATTLKRVQKQKNTVMESAITSWQSSKADLGRLVSVLSEDVERVDEETYKITVRASYEQRELDFVLTAEEVVSDNYGGTSLAATEMVFTPIFTTGEKLERAAMNTLMGMGTVFLVLIFISFIIASLKNVNTLEANFKAKQEAKKAAAVPAPDGAARTKTYRDGRVAQETDEEGNTTSYTYDADGNILTVTRADGARAEYTYNAMNLPLAAEDFEGNRTVFTYDEKGNLLTRTSGEGNTWRYAYDELSRLVSVTDANGQTTEFSYDGAVVTQMKDAEGYIWRYDYDRMNRMLSMVDPLGNAEIYTYNRNGWKINETAKDGGTTEYEYSPVISRGLNTIE